MIAALTDAGLVQAITVIMNTVQLVALAYIGAMVGENRRHLRR